MKKSILFAAVLTILASCNKDRNTECVGFAVSDRISVTAEQTKTEMSHANGKFSFVWKAGDAVSLMEYVSEESSFKSGMSDPLTADASTAAFTVKLDAQSLGSGQQFHYVATYPASDKFGIMGWSGTGSGAYPILSVEIPSEQSLPSNTSFDPAADIMVSDVVDAASRPEDLSLRFARIGGILQLHLTGLPTEGSSNYVESGSISVSGTSYHFAGSFLYYPGDTMIEPVSSSGGSASEISFSATSGVCPVVDGETDIFLRCCAGSLSGDVTVELSVNVDGEQHLFTKNFTIGSGTGFSTGTGSTGTGAITTGTGATGTSTGVTLAEGNITRFNIAMAEIPAYQVYITTIAPSEDKCVVEAEVTGVKGGSLTSLNAHIYYGTTFASTPEEFIGKSSHISAGSVPEDGKIFCEISGLSASTKYYLVVAVDDGKTVYTNEKIEEFQTTSPKTPLSKVTSINFNTTYTGFTASWSPVTGAIGYNCLYWSEKTPSSKIYLSSKYSSGKWSATATGLTVGKYYFQAIPVPDATHSECKENDSFEVTIEAPAPYIIFNAEYKDGKARVWGTIDNYSSGTLYIHYDAGSGKSTQELTIQGSTSVTSGTFEQELSDTFTEGQTYSFGGSVIVSGSKYYSGAVAIKIESGGGGKDPAVTKLSKALPKMFRQ